MSCFEVLLNLQSFFKNEPRIKTELTLMYKRRFENTIFYESCISTLRYITRERQSQDINHEQEDQQQPFGRKSTRKSSKLVSHYQNATVGFEDLDKQNTQGRSSKRSIPNTLSYMSINEKQQLLRELIEKSYVFIDLTDLFSGEDLETYENMVRKEIFQGQESIVESILETSSRKGVKDRLKYFDTEALNLLNIYVSFCEKIKLKLRPQHQQSQTIPLTSRDQFVSRLILQLKAQLQIHFPSQKFSTKYAQLTKMVAQFKIMNEIIVATIQKTQGIQIIPESSHEYAQNFFTYPNISTLVSVILFMDENFLKAIFERFLEGLKICIARMGEKLVAIEKLFLNRLKQDYFGVMDQPKVSTTHDFFTHKSNLNKILQGGQQIKFQYFRKSLRTLQTLTTQREPIKCLKIIYQLNKTIQKQHTEFINSLISQESQREFNMESTRQNIRSMSLEMRNSQKTKKYSFSRETQRMIIEFLLARKKDNLRFIVTNIMITHFFVHPAQLKDKKGSCLAPFVQIVKNIGYGVNLE